MRYGTTWIVLLGLLAGTCSTYGEGKGLTREEFAVTGVQLQDLYYQERSLDTLTKSPFTVLYFFSNTCPIARRYTPRIEEFHQRYSGRGVQFVGINASTADTVLDVAQYALDYHLSFKTFNDSDGSAVRVFGVTRTPEVIVIDDASIVRYQGRVDDQYRLGGVRPTVGRHDLKLALEELLGGLPITLPRTRSEGCSITEPILPVADDALTYADHVRPLLQRHCQSCHEDDAPTPLDTYSSAIIKREKIRETLMFHQMPPSYIWCDGEEVAGLNDTLSQRQRLQIIRWTLGESQAGSVAPISEVTHRAEGVESDSVRLETAARIGPESSGDVKTFQLAMPNSPRQQVVQLTLDSAGDSSLQFGLLYTEEGGGRRYLTTPMIANMTQCAPSGTAIGMPTGHDVFIEAHYKGGVAASNNTPFLDVQWAGSDALVPLLFDVFDINVPGVIIPTLPSGARLVGVAPSFPTRVALDVRRRRENDVDSQRLFSIPAFDPAWPLTCMIGDPSQMAGSTTQFEIRVWPRTADTVLWDQGSGHPKEEENGLVFIEYVLAAPMGK